MPSWDQRQPIYQQLADLLAAKLLDGEPPEGQAMPSVRALAALYLLNPLTVNRALQALGDAGLLEHPDPQDPPDHQRVKRQNHHRHRSHSV